MSSLKSVDERPGALTARDWLTFVQLLGFIALVNVAVRVLPFRRVATWLMRGRLRTRRPCEPARLAALVARASAYVWPAPSCLTRSLVLCRLLVRRGVEAQLVLGVNTGHGRFTAHAWVEHDGRTMHDDASGTDHFTTLCRIDHHGAATAASP